MKKTLPDVVRYANQLLDIVIQDQDLKNDAALCRVLGIGPPVLSRVRNGRAPFGAALMISAHEETGVSIKDLKRIIENGLPASHPFRAQSSQIQ